MSGNYTKFDLILTATLLSVIGLISWRNMRSILKMSSIALNNAFPFLNPLDEDVDKGADAGDAAQVFVH